MSKLEKLVEELSTLSVLEAADLSKMLEEKWGVSAAAPVMAAAGPAAAGPAAEGPGAGERHHDGPGPGRLALHAAVRVPAGDAGAGLPPRPRHRARTAARHHARVLGALQRGRDPHRDRAVTTAPAAVGAAPARILPSRPAPAQNERAQRRRRHQHIESPFRAIF